LLKGGGFEDPASESARAAERLREASGIDLNRTIVALVHVDGGVTSPPGMAEVTSVAAKLRRDPAMGTVLDLFTTGDRSLISRDHRSTYIVAALRAVSLEEQRATGRRLGAALAGDPHVTLGGYIIAEEQVEHQVAADLARAEALAFPILFLLSLVIFRGVVAALLPLLVGGLTIILTFLGLRAVDQVTDLSIFALNIVTGLGLGLAIDYSLLMVSRYREEAAERGHGAAALQTTLSTAGRTVLVSSITVAAAMASLLVFPFRFLYSMGVGGVIVTLTGAAVALVVLPAVLALLGPRVDSWPVRRRRSERPSTTTAWYRLAAVVMRHPGVVAALTAGALLALGIPSLGIKFTTVDATVLPSSASGRQVDSHLRSDFAPYRTTPVRLLIEAPRTTEGAATVARHVRRVVGTPGIREVLPPRPVAATTWQVDAITATGPLSDTSRHAVEAIRSLAAPFPVLVGGETAAFVDLQSSLGAHLPIAFAIVALSTLLVLFAATGSVILPLKSVLMNALSLSATFGALVLIFQDGRLEGLLGYTGQGALESSQPVLLFAIAFGLSTDYGVSLLLRIREAHDQGLDNRDSVAHGLERTGRVITAAALLFCVAVGAFATSSIIFIKEVGVGIAIAVILDATVVRALLVPALMALLGSWNWWAPGPLRRLHRALAG
ncbi:MAG: MMPL family transporter, partial [Candidatus Dormibacteria bacterium]